MARPIFIFSLPRAGSTLLQRLLMADGRCASVGEPSFLLRLLGEDDVIQRRATFCEGLIQYAKDDMRKAWPGFDDTYRAGVRSLALSIYEGLANGKEWFLDKTPRYHLIADEIIRTFPDARFIVLWRHPLAVAASLSSTFRHGDWCMDEFGIDLHAGMDRLLHLRHTYPDRICQVRYEDLVTEPERELEKIGRYLEWENLGQSLKRDLITNNNGRLGDPTGIHKYKDISPASRDAWQSAYNNWHRILWARRYFSGARVSHFQSLGYELPVNLGAGQIRPFTGLRERIQSVLRRRRKITHPVAYPRMNRTFFKRHGYHVNFT